MGKLTATSFITLDNVVEDPHLWSGDFQSEDTGALNDAVLARGRRDGARPRHLRGLRGRLAARSGDPFADKFNSMPKYVVSTTLETADWNNSTILARGPVRAHPRAQGRAEPARRGAARRSCRGCSTRASSTSSCSSYSPIVLGEGKRLFGTASAGTT